MKKLQNSLYITRDGAYLHKERETLLVEQTVEGQRKKLLQIPIHSVGNIFCFGNVLVSPQYLFTRTGLTASVLPGWDNLSSRCTP